MRALHAAIVSLLLAGCDTPTEPAKAPAVASPVGSSAVSAARGRAFHYDVVLSITEGATKTQSSFSLDLAEGKPANASIGKNVMLAGGHNRSDVATKVKASLTMEGDVPKLELDTALSAVDASGTVFRVTSKGAAATPLGKSTTVIDVNEGGKHVELSATPAASVDLGADTKAEGSAVLDIVASPKATELSLTITGDAPATASKVETVPLQVSDGGISPRQDTGTRVKVTGHSRSGGMVLEFNIEMSAVEPATPSSRIRKIIAAGEALVPYDKPTSLLVAEEDGQRYGIMVTLHHPKASP